MKETILILFLFLLTSCGQGVEFPSGGGYKSAEFAAMGVAKYTLDPNGCLESDNAEAVVLYSHGNNQSETLVWNCADYEDHSEKHIELLFTSNDKGECLKYRTIHVAPGKCNTPAKAPTRAYFEAKIADFQLSYDEDSGLSYVGTIQNTGNVTLMDLSYEINNLARSGGLSISPGETYNIGTGTFNIGKSTQQTYEVTMTVRHWDGTVLDTKSKAYTSN